MHGFSEFISSMELVDLPLVEEEFIWSNKQDTPTTSRIGRFLVSPEQKSHDLTSRISQR